MPNKNNHGSSTSYARDWDYHHGAIATELCTVPGPQTTRSPASGDRNPNGKRPGAAKSPTLQAIMMKSQVEMMSDEEFREGMAAFAGLLRYLGTKSPFFAGASQVPPDTSMN